MLYEYNNLNTRRIITSKDIIEKTGISRATLNNYIKIGIIPRPLIRKPLTGATKTKRIGHYPEYVLDRIDTVKTMKKEGYTIDEIARRLSKESPKFQFEPVVTSNSINHANDNIRLGYLKTKPQTELKLTFKHINHPSYLINEKFEIVWINEAAENSLFKQIVSRIPEGVSRNIFKLFFHWELCSLVRNWKDLINLHIGLAKSRYSPELIIKMYQGISEHEASILRVLYERALIIPPGKTIVNRQLLLLNRDNTTSIYLVHVLFCLEGYLFMYVPEENF